MPNYEKGQKVNYRPVGDSITGADSKTNKSVGIIRDISTSNTNLTGRSVSASDDMPRYEIENVNTHKRSAIKECNIDGPAE
ncbi:hypothetical protein N7508_008666 [Penicillium antarcticum]|uniref:uncharacterized protein n=1 Tax=Penicillium antarcticum TaxID=416450 RepID=UPI00239087C5|nr:uncharacterized protein N7508_008666 [Penicillium antarcticum]KAJ5293845.1 hypothetical protein N7508_008666 [Penicillium antarcticum]